MFDWVFNTAVASSLEYEGASSNNTSEGEYGIIKKALGIHTERIKKLF